MTGDLPLDESVMVCVPAKEHYNCVDLCFKEGMNIQVAEIRVRWLNYENKCTLGYEIEKRWNQAPKLMGLLERSINGLEHYKTLHPESWTEADEEHLAECREELIREARK
mgnify:FL=1